MSKHQSTPWDRVKPLAEQIKALPAPEYRVLAEWMTQHHKGRKADAMTKFAEGDVIKFRDRRGNIRVGVVKDHGRNGCLKVNECYGEDGREIHPPIRWRVVATQAEKV